MTLQHATHESTSTHSTHHLLISTARQLTHIGISVVATDADKLPVIKWGPFQERIATEEELMAMFTHPKAKGIAMIGGRVSGNLFTLDFEGKDHNHNPMPSVYPQWADMAQAELARLGLQDLFEKIPVIRTQHSGYHAKWFVLGDVTLGNEKLAKRWAVNTETGEILTDKNGKPIATLLIESKGEGGYALCPPSPGYELLQGDLIQIPILPIGVHELLVSIAKSFHTAIESTSRVTSSFHETKAMPTDPSRTERGSDDIKPGNDYNSRGNWRSLLEAEGWECVRSNGEQEYWRRPGTAHAWSATFSPPYNVLYVFSTNADPFEADKPYSPFAIYTLLKHHGDFSAAAKDLAAQGFGTPQTSGDNGNPRGNGNGNGRRPHFSTHASPSASDTEPPASSDNGQNGNRGSHPSPHTAAPSDAQAKAQGQTVSEEKPKNDGRIRGDIRKDHLTRFAKQLVEKRLRKAEILLAMQVENEKRCDPAVSEAEVVALVDAVLPRLKTVSLYDIQNTDYPDPNWVIPELLPEGLAILAGRQKIGKSLMAFSIALSVACGGYAMGSTDMPATQGEVLYAALEEKERRIKDKLAKMLSDGELSDEDARRFHIVTQMPRLNKGGLELLDTWLAEHEDARLVVIDVLSKIKPRGTTTSNLYDEEYGIMGSLQSLALHYGVTILVVHHTTKMTFGYVFDEISGTTAISGAADTLWVLKRDGDQGTLHVTGRDIETRDLALRFHREFLMWSLVGDRETTTVSETRLKILAVLKEYDRPQSIKDVADLTGLTYTNVKQRLWQMEKGGLVSSVKGKYTLTPEGVLMLQKASSSNNYSNQSNSSNQSNRVTAPPHGDAHDTSYVTEEHQRNQPTTNDGTGSQESGYSVTPEGSGSLHESSSRRDALDGKGSDASYSGYSESEPSDPYRLFLETWYAHHGTATVDAEYLLPIAQAVGFDLTADTVSPKASLRRLLRHLGFHPHNGFTVREWGDAMYRLEGTASPPSHENVRDDERELNVLLADCSEQWLAFVADALACGVKMRGALHATKLWMSGQTVEATHQMAVCLGACYREESL